MFDIIVIIALIAIVVVPLAAVFRMAHVTGNPRHPNGDKAIKRGMFAILASIVAFSVIIVIDVAT